MWVWGNLTAGLTVELFVNAFSCDFFLLVGIELKYEMTVGELKNPRQAMLPMLAAVGGVVVPACIYLIFNPAHLSRRTHHQHLRGTTQLQTVAAIRYVTNGSYIATLRNYEAIPCSEEIQPLMDRVKEMANKFDACTNAVKEARIKSCLISLHAVFMKWLPYVSCHIFLSKMRQKHLNCSPSRPMYM